MAKFKVSFTVSTSTLNQPDWIYISITGQLEDGERMHYSCDNVESDEPAGIFNIELDIDLNTDNQPKWIYDTISEQLEDGESIYNIVYEMVE